MPEKKFYPGDFMGCVVADAPTWFSKERQDLIKKWISAQDDSPMEKHVSRKQELELPWSLLKRMKLEGIPVDTCHAEGGVVGVITKQSAREDNKSLWIRFRIYDDGSDFCKEAHRLASEGHMAGLSLQDVQFFNHEGELAYLEPMRTAICWKGARDKSWIASDKEREMIFSGRDASSSSSSTISGIIRLPPEIPDWDESLFKSLKCIHSLRSHKTNATDGDSDKMFSAPSASSSKPVAALDTSFASYPPSFRDGKPVFFNDPNQKTVYTIQDLNEAAANAARLMQMQMQQQHAQSAPSPIEQSSSPQPPASSSTTTTPPVPQSTPAAEAAPDKQTDREKAKNAFLKASKELREAKKADAAAAAAAAAVTASDGDQPMATEGVVNEKSAPAPASAAAAAAGGSDGGEETDDVDVMMHLAGKGELSTEGLKKLLEAARVAAVEKERARSENDDLKRKLAESLGRSDALMGILSSKTPGLAAKPAKLSDWAGEPSKMDPAFREFAAPLLKKSVADDPEIAKKLQELKDLKKRFVTQGNYTDSQRTMSAPLRDDDGAAPVAAPKETAVGRRRRAQEEDEEPEINPFQFGKKPDPNKWITVAAAKGFNHQRGKYLWMHKASASMWQAGLSDKTVDRNMRLPKPVKGEDPIFQLAGADIPYNSEPH